MRKFFHENGLSLALFGLFLVSLVGQALTGHQFYNEEQLQHGLPTEPFLSYVTTGHFIEAVFENWESEFLQMGVYVMLTVFLYQKGSSESRRPDTLEPEDIRMSGKQVDNAPWPVKRGGLILKIYENSLGLAFLLLFATSFLLHAVGGVEEYNSEQMAHGESPVTLVEYIYTSRFWFESFQNWQSEFLAIGSMVVLSIFLRQKGSPESKPVYSPHSETAGG